MAEPGGKAGGLAGDALKDAGQQLLSMLVTRAAEAATERVSGLSDRLTSVTENGGTGLTSALRSRDSDDDSDDDNDDDGDRGGRSKIGGFFSGMKDKIKDAVGGGGGGGGSGKKLKVTVISEDLDIGLPLRTTYDLWTQFGDFPTFMKKVETVDQESDEKTNWKAQVLWSHRTWEATIVEQVPDSHIVWKSKGAKGHVDGTVTFTELGRNLTRVMLVLEYWPKGLFERTGNIWRAQGRRARLEFQHFRRHAMTSVLVRQDEIEGWRGEIRDSEVVVTHEDALEEEERARDTEAESAADDAAPEDAAAAEDVEEDADEDDARGIDDEDEDYEETDETDQDDQDDQDDEDDEDYDDDPDAVYEDEVEDYEDEDEPDEEPDEEPDDEPDERVSTNGRSRRRAPAAARSRRGR